MKDFLRRAEAALLWLVYQGFRALPVDTASSVGGWIGRHLGPWLPASKRARRNLALALPSHDAEKIILGMWDNLGRLAGEFPHALTFMRDAKRMKIVGEENLAVIRQRGERAIFFSGHLGNWELTYPFMGRMGLRGGGIYRAANNPYLRWLFERQHDYPDLDLIPKGPSGARRSIETLSDGKSLAMFVDQKMNDGIPVPFFGRPAMTAPALAALALKFGCPVIPFRIIRIQGANFCAEISAPMYFTDTGNRADDQLTAMSRVNAVLEGWIRQYPAQWFWLHRRWPKEALPDGSSLAAPQSTPRCQPVDGCKQDGIKAA